MGFWNFLKKKELAKICELEQKIVELNSHIQKLHDYEVIVDAESEASRIMEEANQNAQKIVLSAQDEHSFLVQKNNSLKDMNSRLVENIQSLQSEIVSKKKQIVELDDNILLQDFGIYTPIYDFVNSDLFKNKLEEIRNKQKKMILDKRAATCSQQWTVDGSREKGRIMTEQNIKQILRCFNDECDVLIGKVKFNNVEAYKDKIQKSFNALNKMNTKNAVSLSYGYKDLKIEELQLAYEYALKKQEEKEEQKRIREQMREEAKLLKDIEEARKDIEKEQRHYTNALIKVNKQLETCDESERELLIEKKNEIESHLSDLEIAVKDIDYREANKRAGYVYVISNIGAFGENVFKIGMTRRLDPMERVDELGDASVPFKFDVHAMIFSDNAPQLEAALHKAFEDRKVNMVNNKREFFGVSIEEIEEVVKKNYDKTVDFIKTPQAEQYRESIRMLDIMNK